MSRRNPVTWTCELERFPKAASSPLHFWPSYELDIRKSITFFHAATSSRPASSTDSSSSLAVKMFRAGVARALYAVTRTQVPRQLPAFRSQISSSLLQSSRITPSFVLPSIRCYSAPAGLSKDEVQGRIMDLLKNFDKVRPGDLPRWILC
jgi:hypothetical protein